MITLADLINVKYKKDGTDYKTGLDCYALFNVVRREILGLREIPNPTNNKALEVVHALKNINESAEVAHMVKTDTPKDGDFVRMIGAGGFPNHCGVYINGMIMHIDNSDNRGSRIDTIQALDGRILDYWTDR